MSAALLNVKPYFGLWIRIVCSMPLRRWFLGLSGVPPGGSHDSLLLNGVWVNDVDFFTRKWVISKVELVNWACGIILHQPVGRGCTQWGAVQRFFLFNWFAVMAHAFFYSFILNGYGPRSASCGWKRILHTISMLPVQALQRSGGIKALTIAMILITNCHVINRGS